MEEIEVPTEHLHESIQESAEKNWGTEENKFSMYIAISTALMAVFAALSGLMAGHHSDEALISQVKASDQWSYYQAKAIKAEIADLKTISGVAVSKSAGDYKTEAGDIQAKAIELEQESSQHLRAHSILARAVTLFQIAIAISAIAILTKKKPLWLIACVIAFGGIIYFGSGLM